MQQYRRHGVFSVTDLVSPAWCELQFDYGLRGKRSRPLKDRPTSFKSASGKTIRVEQRISTDNDAITKHGQAVHKELEREVKPVEVKVDVTTNETRWALRLINLIDCLESLCHGMTREVPVFGIIHGEAVIGIVDEVVRIENEAAVEEISPNSKRRKTESAGCSSRKRVKTSLETTSLGVPERYACPARTKDKGKAREVDVTDSDLEDLGLPKSRTFSLMLRDNKTRGVLSIPSDEDAYSGKMQLMLYRRLLQDLISTSPPYNFNLLWQKVGVNASAQFPEKFSLQTGDSSSCLNDLVEKWCRVVAASNVTAIDPTLELVYRLRTSAHRQKPIVQVPRGDPEDEDLARAILASLADIPNGVFSRNMVTEDSGSGSHTGLGVNSNSNQDESDSALQWALAQSIKDISDPTIFQTSADDAPGESKLQPDGDGIIGAKRFLHNDQELDGYIGNVLRWWRGERKAKGVDLKYTYRCNTCEYRADCEWREEKALEVGKRTTRI
ncbi:hypothetical protein CVT24_008886 [Panaeolus cyanescens]|uniref:Exonuclease V n=1 Tax=Panaeolus cyanescens TaxID=181874 RepID=A0A409VAX3_9AGAR|nr:hypothetical protein CVT24_008886 [Panaeolus cyanescens]